MIKYNTLLKNKNDEYYCVEVEGIPIEEDLPYFKAGELCFQRMVDQFDELPITYQNNAWVIVHIKTGAKFTPKCYSKALALAEAKNILNDKTQDQVNFALKRAEEIWTKYQPTDNPND